MGWAVTLGKGLEVSQLLFARADVRIKNGMGLTAYEVMKHEHETEAPKAIRKLFEFCPEALTLDHIVTSQNGEEDEIRVSSQYSAVGLMQSGAITMFSTMSNRMVTSL